LPHLDNVIVADGVGDPEEGEGYEAQKVGYQVILVLGCKLIILI
jgi:hypothetical protein